MRFEWDERKARANLRKHGVSFEDASTVFLDDNARLLPDFAHSTDEDRFYLIGYSRASRFLTVCHCYRLNGNLVRIISAWKATSTETKCYEEF